MSSSPNISRVIPRILVDMDDVLVDFTGGVARDYCVSMADLEANWVAGTWEIFEPLSRATRCKRAITPELFWANFDGRAAFWDRLEHLPWMDALLDLVRVSAADWHIVSSPSYCATSYAGKVAWLKRTFGRKFNKFALTPHKEIFAGPGVVLIDDRDANIEKFAAAGGVGIVFPRHHNSLHAHKADPMAYVRERLAELVRSEWCPPISQEVRGG